MIPQPIYLDNNATTRIDPRVAQAMYECDLAGYVNPASQHRLGRQARRVLEEARETIGRILGCRLSGVPSDQVILTSGGTEANNLALQGLAGSTPGRVLISSIEHPSVVGPAEQLQRRGFDVQPIRVSRSGVAQIDHLRDLLTPETRLVSVMLGNNETGVLQPVREIAALCEQTGVPLHTDAVQAVGKIAVSFQQLQVTALTLTAHKFHGPRGIGALLLRHDAKLDPIFFGGFQQMGLRPGTESVALAVGLRRALELWRDEADLRTQRMQALRDRLESLIAAEIPTATINGADAPRLPHTTNIALPGLDRQALLMALDMAGVACSTGSACASGSSEPSPVLLAMGIPGELVGSSLRFSLGADTTESEITDACRRICRIVKDL
jgi:cysteine desulfurase